MDVINKDFRSESAEKFDIFGGSADIPVSQIAELK
jgi:hypothetical protein